MSLTWPKTILYSCVTMIASAIGYVLTFTLGATMQDRVPSGIFIVFVWLGTLCIVAFFFGPAIVNSLFMARMTRSLSWPFWKTFGLSFLSACVWFILAPSLTSIIGGDGLGFGWYMIVDLVTILPLLGIAGLVAFVLGMDSWVHRPKKVISPDKVQK